MLSTISWTCTRQALKFSRSIEFNSSRSTRLRTLRSSRIIFAYVRIWKLWMLSVFENILCCTLGRSSRGWLIRALKMVPIKLKVFTVMNARTVLPSFIDSASPCNPKFFSRDSLTASILWKSSIFDRFFTAEAKTVTNASNDTKMTGMRKFGQLKNLKMIHIFTFKKYRIWHHWSLRNQILEIWMKEKY